tara:strand:- start:548 stop:745 length:198 start_codon:yes stop_codon:yes gene_type:complete
MMAHAWTAMRASMVPAAQPVNYDPGWLGFEGRRVARVYIIPLSSKGHLNAFNDPDFTKGNKIILF